MNHELEKGGANFWVSPDFEGKLLLPEEWTCTRNPRQTSRTTTANGQTGRKRLLLPEAALAKKSAMKTLKKFCARLTRLLPMPTQPARKKQLHTFEMRFCHSRFCLNTTPANIWTRQKSNRMQPIQSHRTGKT